MTSSESTLFGDGITNESHSGDKSLRWSFDNGTAENFPSHVKRSVPGYEIGHELICKLSDFFVHDSSTVIELGSSCGDLIANIHRRHQELGIKCLGIDAIEEMTSSAKARHLLQDTENSLVFETDDIVTCEYPNSSLILSYYTIQFVHPSVRQKVFDKIHKSLEWGGAFILFEKVRAPDARFQDIISQLYMEYKLSNGYTPDQIISKTISLKGVLEPFSSAANIDMAMRSGFQDYYPIFKHICFEGTLFIK